MYAAFSAKAVCPDLQKSGHFCCAGRCRRNAVCFILLVSEREGVFLLKICSEPAWLANNPLSFPPERKPEGTVIFRL